MPSAVYDANIWVSSATYPERVPDQSIDLAREGKVLSVTSEPLIEQVTRTLLVRFSLPAAFVAAIEAEIRELSELVHPTQRLSVITEKESDNRVLECAVSGRVDYIVTGDRKHLLKLGAYEGIPLLSPADFLRSVQP